MTACCKHVGGGAFRQPGSHFEFPNSNLNVPNAKTIWPSNDSSQGVAITDLAAAGPDEINARHFVFLFDLRLHVILNRCVSTSRTWKFEAFDAEGHSLLLIGTVPQLRDSKMGWVKRDNHFV